MEKKPLNETFGPIGQQMNVIFDSMLERRMQRRRDEFAKQDEAKAERWRKADIKKYGHVLDSTRHKVQSLGIDADRISGYDDGENLVVKYPEE